MPGRAVVFSGTTVAVALLALVILPIPFLRSIGIAGMLIPLVSVAVALTLLPVVLATIGPRLDWPRRARADRAGPRLDGVGAARGAPPLGGRHRVGRRAGGARRRRVLAPARQSAGRVARAGGTGARRARAARAGGHRRRAAVAVRSAGAPRRGRTAGGRRGADPRRRGRTRPGWSPSSRAPTAAPAKAARRSTASAPKPARGWVARRAQSADFVDAVYGKFAVVVALISALTFLLLVRAFRSLLLPLKAVILNLLSVAAAWGVMVLVWQQGIGSETIWGIEATRSITVEMPAVVFAFLFGVSMDYQVFIVSRMREAYDRTGSTETAVIEGIGRTGRLVTSAALILGLAFVALSASPGTEVKMFATALAAGILIDATIVRALLVPAVVSIFGRWNWWLPALAGAAAARPAVGALGVDHERVRDLVVQRLVALVPQRPQAVEQPRHVEDEAADEAEHDVLHQHVADEGRAGGHRPPVLADDADAEPLLGPGLAVVLALAPHRQRRVDDEPHEREHEVRDDAGCPAGAVAVRAARWPVDEEANADRDAQRHDRLQDAVEQVRRQPPTPVRQRRPPAGCTGPVARSSGGAVARGACGYCCGS